MCVMSEDRDMAKRMRVATCSDQRRDLLISLNRGKKSLRDLRDEFHLDSATIVHALRELERHRFVQEDAKREYSLTVFGRIVSRKVIDLLDTSEAVALHEVFWLEHDTSGIPDHLLDRISALRHSDLITEHVDLFKVFHTLVGLFKECDTLDLITPVFVHEAIELPTTLALSHKHLRIVLTENVLQRLIIVTSEALVKNALQLGVKIYVIRHNPKLILAVTDKVIALILTRVDGAFDYSQLLTSRRSEAIAWGHALFRHYTEPSQSVAL